MFTAPQRAHVSTSLPTVGSPLRDTQSSQLGGISLGSEEIQDAIRAGACARLGWNDILGVDLLVHMGFGKGFTRQQYIALIWSPDDDCLVMAITYTHGDVVRDVFGGDSINPGWFDPGRFAEKVSLAKAIVDNQAKGSVLPPYEVVVRWLNPSGNPNRRAEKLNKILGFCCNSNPERYRAEISNYAMAVAGKDAAITVTIRNAKRCNLIADEYIVDEGIDPLQLRWMEPSAPTQS